MSSTLDPFIPTVDTETAYALSVTMKCPEVLDRPWYQTITWTAKWGASDRVLTVTKCHQCGEVMPMAPIKFAMPKKPRKKDVWFVGCCSMCRAIYWAPTRKGRP